MLICLTIVKNCLKLKLYPYSVAKDSSNETTLKLFLQHSTDYRFFFGMQKSFQFFENQFPFNWRFLFVNTAHIYPYDNAETETIAFLLNCLLFFNTRWIGKNVEYETIFTNHFQRTAFEKVLLYIFRMEIFSIGKAETRIFRFIQVILIFYPGIRSSFYVVSNCMDEVSIFMRTQFISCSVSI